MTLIIKEQQESCENERIWYICKENFEKKKKKSKIKNIIKLDIILLIQESINRLRHSICNLKYNLP